MSKASHSLILLTTGLIDKEQYNECFRVIKRDLKILEVVKKFIKIKELLKYAKEYDKENNTNLYSLIQEWLEDETR